MKKNIKIMKGILSKAKEGLAWLGQKIKRTLMWLVMTKLGLLVTSFIWICIWMGVYNNVQGEWPMYVALPGFGYIAVLFLIMMAYAWVINPIRDWKKRREYKKNNK